MRRFKKKKRSRPFGHSGGPRKHSQADAPNLRRIREKGNVPPPNPSVQDVPRSLKEFMKLKELASEPTKSTKMEPKSKQSKIEDGKASNSNNKATVKNQTLNIATKSSNKDTAENTNIHTEQIGHEKSRIPTTIKKKRKLKLQKLKMKRKLKKELKKKEIEEDKAEPDLVKDVIKFGEVVHRPPQISTLPRVVSKPGFAYRPGRADDLLVKSILKKNTSVPYKTRLCAKRKHLSFADQRQLETEKNEAILMYRNLKMKRTKTKS